MAEQIISPETDEDAKVAVEFVSKAIAYHGTTMERLKEFEGRVQDFRNQIIKLREQYETQSPVKSNQA